MSTLIDRYGNPLVAPRSPPYSAAAMDREMARWRPPLNPPDQEILRDRNVIVSRTRDMIRNDGLASGGVRQHLDSVIGAGLLLAASPDWAALGIDEEVAETWSEVVEAKYRSWANDSLFFYSDAGRRLTQTGRLAQGYRSYLTDGEILSQAVWRKKRGPWKYRTCIRMIDSDRLKNPNGRPDTGKLRGGVELDEEDVASAYHLTVAHPNDRTRPGDAVKWVRVERETAWGRQVISHIFDQDRPGQTRGISNLVTTLSGIKMLQKLKSSHLQASILNAVYAAVLESDLPTEEAIAALGTRGSSESALEQYMVAKTAFKSDNNLYYDGARVTHLFPGEKLKFASSEHPAASFEKFEESTLRYLASGYNLSYEQLSRDYSKTNYSSARASLLEVWKFFLGRRFMISGQQATFEYSLWLEEAINMGEIILPKGAPDFYEARVEWTRCFWIGPGRQYIDPLKEAKADRERYDLGTATFQELCANDGRDYRDVLRQRAREQRLMEKLELTTRPPTDPKVQDQKDAQDTQNTQEDQQQEKTQ